MSAPELDGLENADAINLVAQVIDDAFDNSSAEETTRAFSLLDALARRTLPPVDAALLHYFRANAWENRLHEAGKQQSWDWELPEVQHQILELRRAVRHEGFEALPQIRQCQILTNLANKLDVVGRFIDAIAVWDRAITVEPRFAMALGNRGNGLLTYAGALYDSGHVGVLYAAAAEAFSAASSNGAIFDSPGNQPYRAHFSELYARIAGEVDLDAVRATMPDASHRSGESSDERAYRNWALGNRLFINPLNDLGNEEIATHDVLTLPSITMPVAESSGLPPPIIGFFNQMKQEYASARYLFFEGQRTAGPHYSDMGVLLYNTLDYPSYALSVEKMRAAYRMAYSLFDKIAYFLNDYLSVGYPPDRVNFRNVWFEHRGPEPRPLRAMFAQRQNWPLRGLFWISKDLFDADFREATDPDAEALAAIRNHLEHKYLQVHESAFLVGGERQDGLVYRIGRSEFESKTLRVLKLARAALIHLALSVHREEAARHEGRPEGLIGMLPLSTWDDEWKT